MILKKYESTKASEVDMKRF